MFVQRAPVSRLNAFVERVWWSRREEPSLECEHMLPSGKVQLVVTLHDRPIRWAPGTHGASWTSWTRGVVHGPQSSYYLAGPKPKGTVIGVSFHPGAAGAVLGVPTSALLDRHVTLEDLWGRGGVELQERIAAISEPSHAVELLEQALLARLHRPLLIHPAIAGALQMGRSGPTRVDELQRSTGYSPRRFIELFRFAVGLAPKHYLRIQRFASVLGVLAGGDEKLIDLALTAGYSDQAHFSREFREFAGVAPSTYRPRSLESLYHHVAGS